MASVDGHWAIEVRTLAGSRRFDLWMTTQGSIVTGTAVGSTGETPLRGGVVDGARVTFGLEVASVVPVGMAFDLTFAGDDVHGTATSGPYPPQVVVGRRIGG